MARSNKALPIRRKHSQQRAELRPPMANDAPAHEVQFLEKIGYGLGDAACNVVFQMVMSFMAYFYTDVFGLAPAAMGTLFLLVRAVSSIADPAMGALCDRTSTRWGKFRPYLLWLSLPYALIAVLAFTTPDFSANGKLIYAYITYSLLMVVYAAINVPYCALGAVLTANSRERVSLNGYRFFLATSGGALVVAATLPLVSFLGDGDEQKGFQLAVAVLAGLAVLMFLACFAATKERVVAVSENTSSFWHDLRYLLSNDQWRVVAAINFVLFIALVIQDGSTVYYVIWFLKRPDLIGAFLTIGMVSSMVGSLFAGPLVARLSKPAAYAILQATIVVASVALFLLEANQLFALFLFYGIQQFFTQMASPILWSMIADTADYGEFKTGRRITALTFSGALLALKMGTALGGAILGWMLAYYGYQSGVATQSANTVYGIVILFTLVPAIGHISLIALVRLYRLDDERCDQIRSLLIRRKEDRGK